MRGKAEMMVSAPGLYGNSRLQARAAPQCDVGPLVADPLLRAVPAR